MKIFPNPNKGVFTIEIETTDKSPQSYDLGIYSLTGALVYSMPLDFQSKYSKQINIAGLSKGVYLLQLKSDDNILITRLIIE